MKNTIQDDENQRIVLRAVDIWKSYDQGTVTVLKGVDLECSEGRSVALCGPSGCGKSTLLHLFAGLDTPYRGKVFVFQLHNLIPDLTLAENCLIPTVAAGTNHRTAKARLMELAERTGLSDRLDHRIQKLSGGERQRTALCRALMNRPKILLADEPTGSLDEQTSEAVFDLLLELVASEGTTLLMATHDRSLAARCDRLVEMRGGKIREHAYAG